jgi:hypothetical protein
MCMWPFRKKSDLEGSFRESARIAEYGEDYKKRRWLKATFAATGLAVTVTGCALYQDDIKDLISGKSSGQPSKPLVYQVKPPCPNGKCGSEPAQKDSPAPN